MREAIKGSQSKSGNRMLEGNEAEENEWLSPKMNMAIATLAEEGQSPKMNMAKNFKKYTEDVINGYVVEIIS